MRLIKFTSCFLLLLLVLSSAVFSVWFFSPHLPDYVTRRQATFNDRRVTFLLVNLTQANYRFSLIDDSLEPKDVRTWRADTGADLVFNAAYFNEHNQPAGYFRAEGRPSAVSWPSVDEQANKAGYTFYVGVNEDSLDLKYLPAGFVDEPTGNAFLSFPTLVANGEPMVDADSYQYASRTILATSSTGDDYLIITEKGSLSLFEAAEWLLDQPEDFIIAGNLDGGPSTGLSLENGYFDLENRSSEVPSVITGRKR